MKNEFDGERAIRILRIASTPSADGAMVPMAEIL